MDPSGFPVPATTELYISHPAEYPIIPPSHGPNHNHPPYAEMITAAISALKERNGSSRQAIAKYIERIYKDQLPPTHSALLTHHLKRLKTNGHLVMFKHSYKLPRSDSSPPPPASTPSTDTARKRGRPPKPKATDQPTNESISAAALVDGPPLPPPTSAAALGDGPPPAPTAAPTATATATATRRKPGRPPRAVSSVMGPDVIKKNAGRPRKTKLVSGVMGPERIKRGPGRPAKIPTMPVMIPYLSDDVPPRPRGRPKKDGSRAKAPGRPHVLPVPPMNATAASNGGGVVWEKRRGRPPKVGVTKKPVKGTRKPAGRPRKNNALVRAQSAAGPPLWMVDYGYVKSKLDNVQSRIKQAVSLLKPQLTNENVDSVAAALHELEEISTMDVIGAPSHAVQIQEPVPRLLNVEGQEQVLHNQEPHLEHLRV